MNKTLSSFAITTILFCCLLLPNSSFGDKFFEDSDAFFLKYLKQQKFDLDTSASAIVLYEHHSYTLGNHLIHRVRKIIKIVNKSGIEYSDVMIPLRGAFFGYYRVKRIHGTTYNLDGDKIIKQEIDKENIATEETKLIKETKFSMPSVRAASIIDYSYEVEEEHIPYNFAKWNVQENLPKLYTQTEVFADQALNIIAEDQVVPVFIKIANNTKDADSTLPFAYTYEMYDAINSFSKSWVRRNVHAFETEPFISSESNYRESMQLYVKSIHQFVDFGILDSWDKINSMMLKDFSKPLLTSEDIVKAKAKEIAGNDSSDIRIAKRIFKYVRDSISTDESNTIFSDKELSKVLREKSGTGVEVNMLLIAMLRYASLSCSDVILVTKDRGKHSAIKPEFYKYNYNICELRINKQKYYLDANEKFFPFGVLSPDCYNGYSRVIDKKDSGYVMLAPGMLQENGLYMVTTTNNATNDYTLNYKYFFGNNEGARFREEWRKDTSEIRKYILSGFKNVSVSIKLKDYKVKNLNDPNGTLTLDFNMSIVLPEESSVLYFNPYFVQFLPTNPFRQARRKYPIDMPYTRNMTYTCNLQLPKGYMVDEVPRSSVVKIDDSTQYKNIIEYDKENGILKIDSRLRLEQISFDKTDYDILKEFFQKTMESQQINVVMKKQS